MIDFVIFLLLLLLIYYYCILHIITILPIQCNFPLCSRLETNRGEERWDRWNSCYLRSLLSFLPQVASSAVCEVSLRQISSLETLNCKKFMMKVLGSIIRQNRQRLCFIKDRVSPSEPRPRNLVLNVSFGYNMILKTGLISAIVSPARQPVERRRAMASHGTGLLSSGISTSTAPRLTPTVTLKQVTHTARSRRRALRLVA